MVAIKSFLRQVDIFGTKIKFSIDKEETAKTLIGGIATLTVIGSVISIFVIMSLDILQKNKPLVTVEDSIQQLHPNITLTNTTLPISVIVQDDDNNNYNIPEIFSIKAKIGTIIIGNNTTFSTQEYLNLVLCNLSHFPLLRNDSFYSLGINHYYCLENQNVTIGGFTDSNYTKYLELSIFACRNSSDSKVICAPESEIEAFFSNNLYYLGVYYQNTIINSHLYSNPKSPYIVNIYKTLKYGTYKLFELFFRIDTLISDNGFLVATNEVTNVTSFDTSNYDLSEMHLNGLLCSVVFYSSNYNKIYRRSYLKIQDVLAKVGALSQILIRIGKLFSYIFTTVRLNRHILNKIFDYDFTKKDEQVEFKPNNILLKSNTIKKILHKKSKYPIDNDYSNVEPRDKFDNKEENANKINDLEVQKISLVIESPSSKKNSESNCENDIFPKLNQNPIIPKSEALKIFMLIKKKSNNYLKLSSIEIIKGFCCKCFMNPIVREKIKLYNMSKLVLDDYLDISYFIQNLEELEKLKLVCLNYDQLAIFNYISNDICTLNFFNNQSTIKKFKDFNKDSIKLAQTIASFKKGLIIMQRISQKLIENYTIS